MKKIALLTCLAALLAPWAVKAELLATEAPIEWPKQYIVETVATMMGTRAPTKMFVDGELIRTETSAGGTESISIVRPDKKVIYSLMPSQKMYMEMPYNNQMAPADPVKGKAKWEQVGSETVNEQSCTKYKLTSEYNGQTTVMFYWINKEKLPVRMATEDGKMVTDYISFKKEKPDGALFELPSDYKKMEMPSIPTMPQQSDN